MGREIGGREISKPLNCRTLGLATALLVASQVMGQPAGPHIGYAYPAGGRQGSTFQVTLGGQFLMGATNVFVSGAGARGTVVEYTRPMTQKEANDLRERMRELQEKRVAAGRERRSAEASGASSNAVFTVQDQKALFEIRKKLMTFVPANQLNPAIAENVTLQITVASDAEAGRRELRLGTPQGMSNPLAFEIGQLPEFSKLAANRVIDPSSTPSRRFNREERGATPPTETKITLPSVVNGQIMPGGVDRYRFHAQAGQHLVMAASARELIPYLPDAVPGWFQAALSLYDAKGHELEHADHFSFHPDPVLYYEVPREGEYVLEIRDSVYRGREDFVYRLTLGEVPVLTGLFPLGGKVGTEVAVELTGWNLPTNNLTVDAKTKPPGVCPVVVGKDDRVSNSMPFALDTLPEIFEQEPNDTVANAQAVTLPLNINGRIQQPGDQDVFRFEARAGSQLVAQVDARKLDSPLDSILRLTDATGRQLAFNDDYEDKGAGLTTHHADSYLCTTLPADGTYFVSLGDAQHKGGPEYSYRLRLSSPRPDFALRVVPASVTVRGGGTVPLTVYALRKDGFTNEISLALKDAPRGFSLGGGKVPAGQDQIRVTLTALSGAEGEPVKLELEGRAQVGGCDLVHEAVPAEDMMQAFLYRHLVPAQELRVAVAGRSMPRAAVRILGELPVRIPAGGTARVQVDAAPGLFNGRLQLELSEPPEGLSLQRVGPSREGTELVLRSDAAKSKPGLKGNLIVAAFANPAQAGKKKGAAQNNRQRVAVTTLPAIPFEIVSP